jgi:hypothetical protein
MLDDEDDMADTTGPGGGSSHTRDRNKNDDLECDEIGQGVEAATGKLKGRQDGNWKNQDSEGGKMEEKGNDMASEEGNGNGNGNVEGNRVF